MPINITQAPGGTTTLNIFGGGAPEEPARPSGRRQMGSPQQPQQSSNAWASNASQNCGNVLTDRSSTRIHNPPGGRCAMGSSFGWDDSNAEVAQPRISSNVYADGANQNCGNVMTGRSSTRIHNPPGGRSAMGSSFGWSDEPVAKVAPKENIPANVAQVEPSPVKAAPVHQQPAVQAPVAPVGAPISSNAYANGANQNCGNVMTGRSSTRIHQPPGGRSAMGSSFAW